MLRGWGSEGKCKKGEQQNQLTVERCTNLWDAEWGKTGCGMWFRPEQRGDQQRFPQSFLSHRAKKCSRIGFVTPLESFRTNSFQDFERRRKGKNLSSKLYVYIFTLSTYSLTQHKISCCIQYLQMVHTPYDYDQLLSFSTSGSSSSFIPSSSS